MKTNKLFNTLNLKVVFLMASGLFAFVQQAAYGEMKSGELKDFAYSRVDILASRIVAYPTPPTAPGVMPVAGQAYPQTWKIEIPAQLTNSSLIGSCMFYSGHHLDSRSITLRYVPSSLSQLPSTVIARSFRGEGVKVSDVNPGSTSCPLNPPAIALPLSLTTNVVFIPLPGTILPPPAPAREFVQANGKLYMIEVGFSAGLRVVELPQQ